VTELHAGIQYRLARKPVVFIPELFVTQPFNSIDSSTDEVLTGEGAFVVQGGFWLKKSILGFHNYLYLGANHRNEGRSNLALHSIGTYLKPKPWVFGAEIYGYDSITDDKETDTPLTKLTVTSTVSGSSLRYYAINPSILEFKLWTGFDFDNDIQINGGYVFPITGKNTARGNTILFGLTWKFDFEKLRKGRSASPFGRKNKKGLNEFQVDGDEYDESLFEEKPRKKRRKKNRRRRKQ